MYAAAHGVTASAIRYKCTRQYIYRWLNRYDGTLESLKLKSRRPHSHKNQHTEEELKKIREYRRRNPHAGLVVLWVKLMQSGYKRSISGLYKVLRREGLTVIKPANPKYIPKPYEQMQYPGQRVQVDVKHVPASCIVGQEESTKWYQYTAIDEYSRFRYIAAFEEASTHASAAFLKQMLRAFPFKVECVQTDNGFEFTKQLGSSKRPTLSLFERRLAEFGIEHRRIRPFTPRHNGKVERSHRKDNEYFYAVTKFHSFEDFKDQLYRHSRRYNSFPMRPLGWLSPKQALWNYLDSGVTYV
jgi:transposase InsO family protein